MKILRAQKHPDNIKQDVRLFDLSELKPIPPLYWLEKRIAEFGYNQSFENHGMIYPITVTTHYPEWVKERIIKKCPHHVDEKGELKAGLYVHTGNKRVVWAKNNGYDQIEGYLVDEKDEKGKIRSQTHIAHGDIPK